MRKSNLVAAVKLVFKDTDLVVLQHLFSFYNSVSYCGILIIFACSGIRVASQISSLDHIQGLQPSELYASLLLACI